MRQRRPPRRADHPPRAGRRRDSRRASGSSALWDEVIHIDDPAVEKADHIGEPDAILIDDSFRERRVARERLGIATFDSSMIELLMDERL